MQLFRTFKWKFSLLINSARKMCSRHGFNFKTSNIIQAWSDGFDSPRCALPFYNSIPYSYPSYVVLDEIVKYIYGHFYVLCNTFAAEAMMKELPETLDISY